MRFTAQFLPSILFLIALPSIRAEAIPLDNHQELGEFYPYAVHQPAGGGDAPSNPAINLFLHGMGSRGDAKQMDDLITYNGPGRRLKEYYNGNKTASATIVAEKFLTVMPIAPMSNDPVPEWNVTAVMSILQAVQQKYPHDPQRIYLSGYSMGARDSWKILMSQASSFAGAAISAGEPDPASDFSNLLDVPIKHYAGTKDFEGSSSLSAAQKTQTSIEKAGGTKSQLVSVPGPSSPAHNSMANVPFFEPMFSDLLKNVGTGAKAPTSLKVLESQDTIVNEHQKRRERAIRFS